MTNKSKNTNQLNSISVFLYSFALVFFEYLLLDLILFNGNITEYKMNFTIGILITLSIIAIITVIYMSEKMKKIKEFVMSSKLNIIALMVAVVASAFVLNSYLNYTLFELNIFPIIILIIVMVIVGKAIEKLKNR